MDLTKSHDGVWGSFANTPTSWQVLGEVQSVSYVGNMVTCSELGLSGPPELEVDVLSNFFAPPFIPNRASFTVGAGAISFSLFLLLKATHSFPSLHHLWAPSMATIPVAPAVVDDSHIKSLEVGKTPKMDMHHTP